jgi:hypothetical protein
VHRRSTRSVAATGVTRRNLVSRSR